ncbi:RTlike1 [Aspergillus parasiticus SU-1]|uniref:RTlike1 n=1 Tax=Aspergillus parasiticus (strain ATCC 56775 / NRRL 5862 / SRRC 143 / SU-1) TaxID=1403190 RepID=A0A0F0IEP7_ASPPU|nr:RTlike1 [Aspergillus parasiticus SU-1]
MSTSGALPQTLRSITDIKIAELSKQRSLFEKQREGILKAAADAPDLRSKARVLLEGITKLNGYPNDAFDREDLDTHSGESEAETTVQDATARAAHVNIRRFLLQSQFDPSVSDRSLGDWVAQLEEELNFLHTRHEHAAFYSNLVTEWLTGLETEEEAAEAKEQGSESDATRRAEMQEQRATWEQYVFNAANVDEKTINEYLDSLFTKTNQSQQALKTLRQKMKTFGDEYTSTRTHFDVDTLQWVSKALLRSDSLTKEKSDILKDFMLNKAVAQEVADVLNMRLAALDNWHWPSEGLPQEMRRQLNGKYRVFQDEDLLDSLLFQYLGLHWAVTFRAAFVNFQKTWAWKSLRQPISKSERARRQHFLGRDHARCIRSVNEERRDVYRTEYFMTQLPRSLTAGGLGYDDDNNDTDDVEEENRKNALETKHSLLHLLIAESIVQTRIHGQFTAIRSDFKYFGPSIPHTTMLTVLAYFGVPQNWLDFFKRFLECPLKFTQDGPEAAVQTRRRGIPISHTLSDCFGEAVLFCMDYAVNQSTDGAYLYRMHDDFWFWGQKQTCIKAWNTMTEFAQVMGLEFNEEKTGTVHLENKDKSGQQPYQDLSSSTKTEETEGSDTLPTGDIRWGFLKLDAQEGRFIIDQEQVDSHISELQLQLSACKSVFSFVQAWNSYFGRFFVNNFARPVMCFGRSHIDMAVTTLNRIERTIFPDSHSGVTDHLRKMIAERFDIHDLPEGFFYFPVEFGGLELTNPYIPLFAIRENIESTPSGRLQKAYNKDEAEYHAAQERFEKDGPEEPASEEVFGDDEDPTAFMSLEEYTRHSETYSYQLLGAYNDLVGTRREVMIDQSPKFRTNQMTLEEDPSSRLVLSNNWDSMPPYWKWTGELYQGEMVKKYGSLAAVSKELMPLGVVQTLKQGKFRWQG